MTVLHRLSLLGAALALVGCASVSPDGLRGDVAQLTAGRTAGVPAALPAADAAAQACGLDALHVGFVAQAGTAAVHQGAGRADLQAAAARHASWAMPPVQLPPSMH